ncbi:Phenylalanine--tRNA ligase beta subunit [compost metagenome]
MKVSTTWLSEYIDLRGYTGEELAEQLTAHGIEVDSVLSAAELYRQESSLQETKDNILDLDLTPNRSDCLSIIGTAYEMGAVLGRYMDSNSLNRYNVSSYNYSPLNSFSVNNEAEQECKCYALALIENVQIGPSPLWIQQRLSSLGVAPVNNVVDYANYIMLECGQPINIYDADQFSGAQIQIRFADEENIMTADGLERTVDSTALLISDGQKPASIAGIANAADYEISPGTHRILIESAHFSGSVTRKTSRKLGLRNEKTVRFEKEINSEMILPALLRVSELIVAASPGAKLSGVSHWQYAPIEHKTIKVSQEKINRYLGTEISGEQIEAILEYLHFPFEIPENSVYLISVPKRRGDITQEVDIIEEIARLYGYEHIPVTLVQGVTTPGRLTNEQRIRRSIRHILIQSGFNETITYSLTHPKHFNMIPVNPLYPQAVFLNNPMTEDRSMLRMSLLPHLLETASFNLKYGTENIAIFEIGNIYCSNEPVLTQLPQEFPCLGMLLTGKRNHPHWNCPAQPVSYYDIKGTVEKMLNYLGIESYSFEGAQIQGLHPGRTANIYLKDNDGNPIYVGYAAQLHPDVQKQYDLKETFVLELSLKPIYRLTDFGISAQSAPKYPSVQRDIAVVVHAHVFAAAMIAGIKSSAGEWLEDVSIFDVYSNGSLAQTGQKSIAFSLVFRHPDRTLTDDDIYPVYERVVNTLKEQFAAELRQ